MFKTQKEIEEGFSKQFDFDMCEDCGSFRRGQTTDCGVKSFLHSTRQADKEAVMKEIELEDAYKMPFSDADIAMELIENHKEIKRVANRWYKKGRSDALSDLLTQLKDKWII